MGLELLGVVATKNFPLENRCRYAKIIEGYEGTNSMHLANIAKMIRPEHGRT